MIEEYARNVNSTYTEVWPKVVSEFDKKSNDIFRSLVDSGKSVVVDKTNMSRRSRSRWLNMTPSGYEVWSLTFSVDDETLKERLAARVDKPISWEIVENMKSNYQPVEPIEGFDYILRL